MTAPATAKVGSDQCTKYLALVARNISTLGRLTKFTSKLKIIALLSLEMEPSTITLRPEHFLSLIEKTTITL